MLLPRLEIEIQLAKLPYFTNFLLSYSLSIQVGIACGIAQQGSPLQNLQVGSKSRNRHLQIVLITPLQAVELLQDKAFINLFNTLSDLLLVNSKLFRSMRLVVLLISRCFDTGLCLNRHFSKFNGKVDYQVSSTLPLQIG